MHCCNKKILLQWITFKKAINACLAHKDQRIDVVRIYIETAHEMVLNALKIYFKKNQDCLEVFFLTWLISNFKLE